MFNEIIFFLGIGILICTAAGAVGYFAFSQIKLSRLREQLDKEFGKEEIFEETKKDKKKFGRQR